MNLTFSSEERAFREEVRECIATQLPDDIRRKVQAGDTSTKDDYYRWQRVLFERGWIAPGWPASTAAPVGTRSAATSSPKKLLVRLGAAYAAVRSQHGRAGDHRVRNDEQRARFLPRILSGEEFWCQGYSEPGSGSDLASLSTEPSAKANYVINGTKTWITAAQWADWIFVLARTCRLRKSAKKAFRSFSSTCVARRQGASDHHDRWRRRDQRSALGERRSAGNQSGW